MITQKQISEQLKAVIEGILVAGSSVERMVDYLAEEGVTLTPAQRRIYTDYLTQLKTNPGTPMPEGFTLRTQDDTYTTPTAKILRSLVTSVCLAKSTVMQLSLTGDASNVDLLQQASAIDLAIQTYVEHLIAPFRDSDITIPLEETSPVYQALSTAIKQDNTEDNLTFHTNIIYGPLQDIDYAHQSVLAYQRHIQETQPQNYGKRQQIGTLADRLTETDCSQIATPANRQLILEAVKHRQAKLPISREQFKAMFLAFIDRALETTATAETLRNVFIENFAVHAEDEATASKWLTWITDEETNPNPPSAPQSRDSAHTNGSRAALLIGAVLFDANDKIREEIDAQPNLAPDLENPHDTTVRSWTRYRALNSFTALFSDMLNGEQGKAMPSPYGPDSEFVQRLLAIREDIANDRPVYINASEPLDILTKTIQHFDYAIEKKQIAASLEGINGQARDNIKHELEQIKTPAQFRGYIDSPAYKTDKAKLPLNRSITTALKKRESRAIKLITEIYQNFHGIFTNTREKPTLDDVLQRYNDPDDKLKIQLYGFRPELAQLLGEIQEIQEIQGDAENNPDISTRTALQHRLDILPYKHQIIAHCNDYEQRLRYSAAKILCPGHAPIESQARAAIETELTHYKENSDYAHINTKLQITIEKLYAVNTMKQEAQKATTREKLTSLNATHLNQGILFQHRDGKTQLFALKVLAVITSLGTVLGENKEERGSYFKFDENKLVQDKVTSSKSSLFTPTSAKKVAEIRKVVEKIPRGPGSAPAA